MRTRAQLADDQVAGLRVLAQVRAELVDDDRDAPRRRLGQLRDLRDRSRDAAGFPHLGVIRNGDALRQPHRPLVRDTRVPLPGADSIANSFTRRRAPPSPIPRPVPVVYPSRSARSTSGIPGPWSSKTRRSPLPVAPASASIRTVPPRP